MFSSLLEYGFRALIGISTFIKVRCTGLSRTGGVKWIERIRHRCVNPPGFREWIISDTGKITHHLNLHALKSLTALYALCTHLRYRQHESCYNSHAGNEYHFAAMIVIWDQDGLIRLERSCTALFLLKESATSHYCSVAKLWCRSMEIILEQSWMGHGPRACFDIRVIRRTTLCCSPVFDRAVAVYTDPGRRILVDIRRVHMDIHARIMDIRIDIHASIDISLDRA